MKRWIRATALGLVAALTSAGTLHAQVGGGLGSYTPPLGQRSPVSPYLNLNRPGTNPAINYYGLVRPQIDTARNLQTLQTEIQTLPTDPLRLNASQPIAPVTLSTGHPATFFNTSHYFGTVGGRGSVGGSPLGSAIGTGRLGTGNIGNGVGTGNVGVGIGLGNNAGAFPIVGAFGR